MAETRSVRITPRLIVGVAVLLLGLAFTLENLGLIDASYVFDFAPLVLTAIGLVKLGTAKRTSAWLSSFIWIFAGIWWVLYNLNVVDVHVIELWPLLLIFAGYSIVRRAMAGSTAAEREEPTATGEKRKPAAIGDETLTGYAVMCGLRRKTATKNFRGGDFTAVMGGCEVDLRDATISQGEAVVDVFAFWGGVDIQVPREWTVICDVTPILGGCADSTRGDDADPDQRLRIQGVAMMGGIEVKN